VRVDAAQAGSLGQCLEPTQDARSSSGYFLGAAMTSILRGLEASTNPGAVQIASIAVTIWAA
jgi:hypothetical protein